MVSFMTYLCHCITWLRRASVAGTDATGAGVFKLTGSRNGFLFSVRSQVEGFCEMEGGFVEGQTVRRRPQIEHIPMGAAVGVETLKNVLA